jgi:hypothetical protein
MPARNNTARRTETRFSAIVLIHLFVEFTHHDGFDCGEEFSGRHAANTQCFCQRQCRPHVPTNDAAHRGDTQLPTKAGDKIPDLPAFKALRLVQDLWAVFAGFGAGVAVLRAPAEDPFGKGAETFFS